MKRFVHSFSVYGGSDLYVLASDGHSVPPEIVAALPRNPMQSLGGIEFPEMNCAFSLWSYDPDSAKEFVERAKDSGSVLFSENLLTFPGKIDSPLDAWCYAMFQVLRNTDWVTTFSHDTSHRYVRPFAASIQVWKILTGKVHPEPKENKNLPQSPESHRPAYDRDHLWLTWHEAEGIGPAVIRDKWNSMSTEDRRGSSPAKFAKIDPNKSGRVIVETALKKARSERNTQGK